MWFCSWISKNNEAACPSGSTYHDHETYEFNILPTNTWGAQSTDLTLDFYSAMFPTLLLSTSLFLYSYNLESYYYFFKVATDTKDESFFECVFFSWPDHGGCEKSLLTICAVLSMVPGTSWWITTPFTFWLVLSRSPMPHWYYWSSHPTELNASSRKDKNFARECNFSVCLSVISNSVSKQNLIENTQKSFECEELSWPNLCAVGPRQ